MTNRLDETVGSVEYDELINSGNPAADVFSVTIRKEATEAKTLKRGTVLAISDADNKAVVLGTEAQDVGGADSSGKETLTANCILADDVEVGTTADKDATAYRTGNFNRNKLIVADGYTLEATDEEELRKCGIILNTAIEA